MKRGNKILNRLKYLSGNRSNDYSVHRANAEKFDKNAKKTYKEYDKILIEIYGANAASRNVQVEKIRRPKINELILVMANSYEQAAREWLKAGELKKAERDYIDSCNLFARLYKDMNNENDPNITSYEKGMWRTLHREKRIEKLRKGKWGKGLEGKLPAIIAISGLILSLFFLSSNFTGNVIGLNQTASNWTGIILFLVGIISAVFYFKRK